MDDAGGAMTDLTGRRRIMAASLGDMTRALLQQITDAADGAALDEIGARLEAVSELVTVRAGGVPAVRTE
jgi:hypothetical protein